MRYLIAALLLAPAAAFGVGLAFLVPAGGSLKWPTNWPGAARIQYVEQRVWLTEAGAAIQPHPLAKIGATFLYYRIQETLTQQIPIPGSPGLATLGMSGGAPTFGVSGEFHAPDDIPFTLGIAYRSEEHTSELQSRLHLVCRLL